MQWTDKRAKVLLEVLGQCLDLRPRRDLFVLIVGGLWPFLGGMRVVKYFSYEIPFLQRESRVYRY